MFTKDRVAERIQAEAAGLAMDIMDLSDVIGEEYVRSVGASFDNVSGAAVG